MMTHTLQLDFGLRVSCLAGVSCLATLQLLTGLQLELLGEDVEHFAARRRARLRQCFLQRLDQVHLVVLAKLVLQPTPATLINTSLEIHVQCSTESWPYMHINCQQTSYTHMKLCPTFSVVFVSDCH